MDEFVDDDAYTVEVFKDPKGDWLRVFRNGTMAIRCLPVAILIENPQVRSVLRELAKAQGLPFRSCYEEMAADRFDPPVLLKKKTDLALLP
jgi:hypothetical protein